MNNDNADELTPSDSSDVTTTSRNAFVSEPPFDAARYWSYLDDMDATEERKAALLQALWGLMARFVELGFGVDPVQTVIPAMIRAALDGEDNGQSGESATADRFNQAAITTRNGDHFS